MKKMCYRCRKVKNPLFILGGQYFCFECLFALTDLFYEVKL